MATTNTSSGDGQLKTFKTFPEFSKLTLADRGAYNALVDHYPPVSNIQFTTLMLWWNVLDGLAVSRLNDNLVISYWLPGAENWSGLSIVGENLLDESICTVFDYLKEKGEEPRLVHVPEFELSSLQHPQLFRFDGERDMDEYVLSLSRFYPQTHMVGFRRSHIRKFLSQVDENDITVRSIDLTSKSNQRMLLNSIATWPSKGTLNDLTQLSDDVLHRSILDAEAYGIENACLFIRNKLHAYILYHLPADKRYVIFCHAKFSYAMPHLFDYAVYAFSRWLAEQGATYINLDLDYNVPMLRMIKLALGPENFFRCYTVRPSGGKMTLR